jgi:isopenicillin-N epimerase
MVNNGRPLEGERIKFGASARNEFLLDFTAAHLNHGSFGATPLAVLAEQDVWRRRMEQRIGAFFNYDLPPALREAAARLAGHMLGSTSLSANDEILLTNHGYGAIRNIARHIAARSGARVVEAALPFPTADAGEILATVTAHLSARTRIAVLDHVSSPTAVVMPLSAMISACRMAGAQVLVDGAHAPGMLELNVPALGADWYVGNAHKWLFAPKGCAFLWARGAAQQGLHPAVISHGLGCGFHEEFDWTGTRDPSAWLAIGAALDYRAQYGDRAIMTHNSDLARQAATMLARRWRTRVGAPGQMLGSMVTIELPAHFAGAKSDAERLRRHLWEQWRIDVPIVPWAGQLWVRISAQIYNTPADYERLATAVEAM